MLYVDDEPFNLTLFKALFKQKYDLLVAGSGMEGLTVVQENPDIQIVISDMRMPHMNGIQFVEKIKSIKKDLHCFILTGFNDSTELNEARERDLIIETFHKPLDKNQIDQYLEKYS